MRDCICYNVNVIVSVINGKGVFYLRNEEGKNLSLFKSGGPIDLTVFPKNQDELITLLILMKDYPVPYHVLGNGSNTLIKDGGYRGIIIKTDRLNNVSFIENKVNVGAGIKLPYLASLCAKKGLMGLERLAGIPCSIGGAIVKNAGCYNSEIASVVKLVNGVDTKTLKSKTITKEQIRYSYRSSNGSFDNFILTSCQLELIPTDINLNKIIKDYAIKRKNSQPSAPSLGSVFLKTSSGIGAGYYIDKAGLKGTKIGGAEISNVHANFIVNSGNAKSNDFISLVDLATAIVKNKFDVTLRKEIEIIGEN